jgi:hypothetical protein
MAAAEATRLARFDFGCRMAPQMIGKAADFSDKIM